MAENPRESNELIESLAALEHEQWIAWSKAVAHEVSEDRRKRWETYWVPYNDLDEDVKEKDREWARKVAEIIAPTTGIGPGRNRDITVKLNVDVSDALTGLKALRREADAVVRALKALEHVKDAINEKFIRDVANEYGVNVIRVERTGNNTVTVVTDSDHDAVGPFIERLGIERRAGIHDIYRAQIESDDDLPARPEVSE